MRNKNESHTGKIPKLRFSEFQDAGEWEDVKLINAITPVIREVAKPDSSYLALGLRSHGKGTFHKPDQAPEKNSMDKLYLVHHDDLIVNITFAWEGAIAIAGKQDHGCYVSHRFPTFLFKGKVLTSDFFRYVIINKAFVYKLGLISPGGAGRNRVMNKKDFLQLTVSLPDTDEQQKIADCLTSLDVLIFAHTQKLETLKTYKKGLLRQLFPAEGETVPELRFSAFRNAPAWEETTLEKVAKYENGKAHENSITDIGKYIVVNSKFISTDGVVRKYSNEGLCLGSVGDVLMVLSDVPNGKAIAKCYLVDSDNRYTVNQRICKLAPKKILGKMLYYMLDRNPYYLAFDDGVKQTNLRKEEVLGCPIMLPSPPEQQKISDCLSSLDELVAAQVKKVEELKAHKEGLMQQLFPSTDEVNG